MKEDTGFLGRWLNNDLTEEEKKEFENTEDHIAFSDIIHATENLDRPEFEVDQNFEKQVAFNKTYVDPSAKKVIRLKPWLYGVAALGLLLFGLQIFVFTNTTIETDIGQIESITLPDGSTVVLNAVSYITYDKKNFNNNRTIQLNGEALFKVAKGSTFSVKTDRGTVTVLGTEFNIYDRSQSFRVRCFEGKVAVTVGEQKEIITKGQGVVAEATSLIKMYHFTDTEPSWINGRSSFKDISLQQLIEELQLQYAIEIVINDIDVTRRYSGFFVHNDLKQALRTSFEPMNIKYTFVNESNIALSNK